MSSITDYKIDQKNFESQLTDYDNSIKWLKNIGYNVDPSRLNKYRKQLIKFIADYDNLNLANLLKNNLYSSLIYEIQEIIEIKNKLSDITDKEFFDSLKKIISGPDVYSEEKNTANGNLARNTSFELYMARYFRRAGYTISFNTIADFNAFDDVTSFFIECKRPTKQETIGPNIKEALEQTIKRFDPASTKIQKGIAAIDISHLINEEHNFITTPNIAALSEKFKDSDNIYSPEIINLFNSYGDTCISVMLHWRLPVYELENNHISSYEKCFSIPICDMHPESMNVFHGLNNKLMKSIGK
jgi:hypothetical protein